MSSAPGIYSAAQHGIVRPIFRSETCRANCLSDGAESERSKTHVTIRESGVV